jgi:hypothetical protein
MSEDTHSVRGDDNSSVVSSPEIYSPLFTNGSVEDIRRAARSPVYKRLLKLADQRLTPVPPLAK